MGKESKKRGDGHLIYDKGDTRICNGEKIASSINGTVESGELWIKEWNQNSP